MILMDIEDRLPALYLASCEDNGAVPYFTSQPGLGKTSVIKLFTKRMKQVDPNGKYFLIIINGATLNIGTMGGYLQFGPLYNGKPTSLFSLPWWWWTKEGKALEEYDGGIILIDEADKMMPDERKSTGEAALEKIWMSHHLPPGVVVWFAGNRMGIDRSGSSKDFDHLINRRREIAVLKDTLSWILWAERSCLLPAVKTFGQENPQLLFEAQPKIQGPWCTPRSLHQAEIHLRALMRVFNLTKVPTDPLVEEEVAGGIGIAAAAKLMVAIRMEQELPTYEQIISAPKTIEIPSKPDGKRLISYIMADRVLEKDAKKAFQFIGRFEQEFQTVFVRQAINKQYDLVFQEDFANFCNDNAELLAIVNRYKVA